MQASRAAASPSPGLWVQALGRAMAAELQAQWYASSFHRIGLNGPRVDGFAAAPRDSRPTSAVVAETILEHTFPLAGDSLDCSDGVDPWNRASPSRRFAIELHRFGWIGDLVAAGEAGQAEALRLTDGWRRVFGRWNSFAWSVEVLERRVFNLACAARTLSAVSTPSEGRALADSLARQARHLLALAREGGRAAEQLAAVAVAGTALAGEPGDKLTLAALTRLGPALDRAVLADGTHASRSPQAGMELLFDLLALDDGLSQRGRPPPDALSRAIDRLSAGLGFFGLPDGRLACFQGGEESDPWRVSAARAHDEAKAGPGPVAPHGGYQRMASTGMVVIADAAPPATGVWSLAATGQPMAIEVVCGRDRLITNCGWSVEADGAAAFRLAPAGSTATIGGGSIGAPLSGFAARALGQRLVGGVQAVEVQRRENEAGVWVEMAHSGWLKRTGLTHERRLFLDRRADELRGEDRFVPSGARGSATTPIAIYFHLHPDVRASLARDQRSVLLQGPSDVGWWLRNDAGEVSVEPSVHFIDGRPRRANLVVMRGRLRADRGGRVRWKLAKAEPAPSPG